MLRRRHKKPAQALVELALAITFLFLLVSAAIDLGLIFFTMQGMRTAAQEGATFGSRPVEVVGGSTLKVDLNYLEIARRVRNSSGQTSTGFANLQDLDGDRTPDVNQNTSVHTNPQDPNAWIYVQLLGGGDPRNLTADSCPTTTPNQGMQRGGDRCWVKVTVRYNYRFLFPLAPAFGDTVRLEVSQIMPVRSSFYITK